jgi:hypothetical protein
MLFTNVSEHSVCPIYSIFTTTYEYGIDGRECAEMSAHKIQVTGNHPE